MKFIESLELREWVKEKLKKKLFQNAHALAVQTGCEILVKLHDTTDVTGCQYYATNKLRKIYRTSKLRQQGEMLVSGETGMPLLDKCIQYEDEPTEGGNDEEGVLDDDDGGGGGTLGDEMNDILEESEMPALDAVPMQLTSSSGGHAGFTGAVTQTTQSEQTDMINQVKQEPLYEQQQQQEDYGSHQQQGMMGSVPQQQVQHVQQQQGYASYPISPKPYQCGICRKAFKSVHVLQKHTLTFHQPGGMSATVSRGRGRGQRSRGNKTRGRGRGLTSSVFSRPSLVQPPFQPTQPPAIKPEESQNRFTCIMCNQQFDDSGQLNEHMSQCPMAPGSSQGALQQPDPSNQYPQGVPVSMPGTQDSVAFSQAGGEFPPNVPVTTSAAAWGQLESPPGVGDGGPADYFGQQTPSGSSSSFGSPTTGQSPGQTPRASGSGTSRTIKKRGVGLGQNELMTKRTLMAAILQIAGPVATTTAVTWGYKFLRMLTKTQFESAAKDLQAISMGTLVSSPNTRGGPSLIFVKKHPSFVGEILAKNPDLCAHLFYIERFVLPVSKAIGNNTVDRLIAHGFVTPEQKQKQKKGKT